MAALAQDGNGPKSLDRGRGFLGHLHPETVPNSTLRVTLTWGLGGAAVVLFVLLAITGPLLMFYYVPVPVQAHESLQGLHSTALFGRFIRNIHYWSANLLIVVAVLHALRVCFTGAFRGVRRSNWMIGFGLLIVVLLSLFSGYLLPWDQRSYWAITISTGMLEYVPGIGSWLRTFVLGGDEIGGRTLLNFHALHTTVLPATMVCLMVFHFWKIRTANGLVVPSSTEGRGVAGVPRAPTMPDLVLREAAAGLGLVAAIFVLAAIFDAPLGELANPDVSPNPVKAPWYFAGVQELLIHLHPVFAVTVLPLLATIALVLIPYVQDNSGGDGVWFISVKGRVTAGVAAGSAVILTLSVVVFDALVAPHVGATSSKFGMVDRGLLPMGILGGGAAGFYWLLRRKWDTSRKEAVQALFVLAFVSFAVLTAIGIWFRGQGMALVWPWQG